MHKPLLIALTALFAAPVLAHNLGRQVTATVYDSWYAGRTTYCGNRYDHWGISAAHPWLECGTKVTVSHKGRMIKVPIRDRCFCNSLDLSAGAAYRLGVPLDGTAQVRISY